jgi:hypothetical protein
MNMREARAILQRELDSYRSQSRSALLALLDRQDTFTRHGKDGTGYQLEIQVFWDDQPGGNLRVMGSIDDGGLRAFVPLTEDFIVAPDGSFVGE